MELSIISCALCLLFTMALYVIFHTRNKIRIAAKLPPGPAPFPLVGNLFHLGDKPHVSLANLAKIHGPIMSLKLGQITTVVISSANLAREVLQKHDAVLSNRTIVDAVRAHRHHHFGLPWIPVGPQWRNLRKICNSYIFANQKLDANQELRRKKIQNLLSEVQESCRVGGVVDIGRVAFKTTLNALSNTIFSLDLADSSGDDGQELKEHVRSIMDEAGKPNFSDYFPVLRKIDPQGVRRRMAFHFGKILNLCNCVIEERVKSRQNQKQGYVNDMLDTLLNLNIKDGEIDKHQMKHLFLALFVAGSDTTSNTLEWAMTELLRNPEALSKARAELLRAIGKGNLLDESDIAKLPFLQAVIKETFRLHPAVPLLLPRKAGEEVEIGGFLVPKGAQVFVNAWAIGRDPSIWEEPSFFRPERFLGSEIDARGHDFELIPFGAGRRICIGLPLAMRLLHLMLGSLIHSFDWKLEDGVTRESIDMEEKFGITLQKAKPMRAVPIQM